MYSSNIESLKNSLISKDDIDTSIFDKSFNGIKIFDNVYKDISDLLTIYNNNKLDIDDIYIEKEDSHYLIYFSLLNKKYISKIRMNNDYISSILIDYFDESYNNVVLTVSYDGSNYFGMQQQNSIDMPSIQSEIEKALYTMTKREIKIISSSRTDRGVHAIGQVINFDGGIISHDKYMYSLNNILPSDIRVISSDRKSKLFNSRFDTIKKEYNYIIDTTVYSVFKSKYVWFLNNIDIDKLNEELNSIIGLHDFKAFSRNDKENTYRYIYEAKAINDNGIIKVKFVGSGFLHNMIRFIIGSVIEKISNNGKSIKDILESKDRNMTNKLAPASGLYLVKIWY